MIFSFSVIILSFLPGFIWLLFFEKEDNHPEPKRIIAAIFIVGMIAAIFMIITGPIIKQLILRGANNLSLGSLALYAFFEEFVKFLFIGLFAKHLATFDEPVDAMIYMVIGALGFASLENLAYLSRESLQNQLLASIAQIASLRFVGSTILHGLSSAIIGYFWALSIRYFNDIRFIFLGIIMATVLHAYFNYLIITYESMFFVFPLLLIAGFFVISDFEELKWRSI